MKAWIEPLKGKFYGTNIRLETGELIDVWVMGDYEPSRRQLEHWQMTLEDAREDGMMCNTHYETQYCFDIAMAIVDALERVPASKRKEAK